MPSFYSDCGLSQQSLDTWRHGGPSARSVQERLNFYLTYLEDVVPHQIGVYCVPIHLQPHHIHPEAVGMEIRLTYMHMTFMTGVVSLQYGNPEAVDEIAANVAYPGYRGNQFVPNGRNWRIFTCTTRLRFCTIYGNQCGPTAEFHPIMQAAEVAEYLQRELDRVRPR